MDSIGTKIHTLRKNKNMTQSELAAALSVSSQSISKWENNISAPDISLLPIIARFFGITMDELFNYRLDALNYRERFIRFMADNNVLQFGEFHLQSGRISPYYINTGNYKSASQILKLGEFYAECIREHNIVSNLLLSSTSCETPITIATGMVLYNKYGIDINYRTDTVGKSIEQNDKITMIMDTLTSGNTLKSTLQTQKNPTISDIIVSVDRMEVGSLSSMSALHEIERRFNVNVHPIVTLDDIIMAIENRIIGGIEYLDNIKRYRDQYKGD